MADITVGHDEGNIGCTMVLLQSMHAAGVLPTPMVVDLANGSEAGWRLAAIEHLDKMAKQGDRPRPRLRRNDADMWAELNEEFDFYEKRERLP